MVKKLITSAIGTVLLFLYAGVSSRSSAVEIFGVYVIPIVVAISAGLYCFVPNIFDMGVSNWKEANLYEKVWPILSVAGILYLSRLIHPTIAVALFNSVLVGGVFSYVGKIWSKE